MKAIVVRKFNDTLDQLVVSETGTPSPSTNEILIKIIAAGVNYVDTLYARGKHQNNRSLVLPPFILGLEFAGVVVSAPPSTELKPGEAVFGGQSGSYAEYITIPATEAASLQRIPPTWSFADAAGLGTTLPVSYAALALRGGLKPGETVLVHSAAGGLGIMAVQIALAMGCRVIGTAGSHAKCSYVKGYGASECFNYSQPDWWEKVLEATDNRGVDVVYDSVGLVNVSLKCIAHRGRVLVIGFAGRDGEMETVAMNRVLLKQVSLIGYRYGESLRRNPQELDLIWSQLKPLIESGRIKPTVHKTYDGLDTVRQALNDLSNRKVSGKAVIRVSPEPKNRQKPKI